MHIAQRIGHLFGALGTRKGGRRAQEGAEARQPARALGRPRQTDSAESFFVGPADDGDSSHTARPWMQPQAAVSTGDLPRPPQASPYRCAAAAASMGNLPLARPRAPTQPVPPLPQLTNPAPRPPPAASPRSRTPLPGTREGGRTPVPPPPSAVAQASAAGAVDAPPLRAQRSMGQLATTAPAPSGRPAPPLAPALRPQPQALQGPTAPASRSGTQAGSPTSSATSVPTPRRLYIVGSERPSVARSSASQHSASSSVAATPVLSHGHSLSTTSSFSVRTLESAHVPLGLAEAVRAHAHGTAALGTQQDLMLVQLRLSPQQRATLLLSLPLQVLTACKQIYWRGGAHLIEERQSAMLRPDVDLEAKAELMGVSMHLWRDAGRRLPLVRFVRWTLGDERVPGRGDVSGGREAEPLDARTLEQLLLPLGLSQAQALRLEAHRVLIEQGCADAAPAPFAWGASGHREPVPWP